MNRTLSCSLSILLLLASAFPAIFNSQSTKWKGDASAQMWLAAAYEQGWFGKANFPEALKWYRRSAEQGDADAQNALGQMYENGEGVAQNYSLAARWYRKAAEHVPNLGGAGQGRNNLGMLYLDGHGVPRDFAQAYMWFILTGSESNPNLSIARGHMTPEEIRHAEQLAAGMGKAAPTQLCDAIAKLGYPVQNRQEWPTASSIVHSEEILYRTLLRHGLQPWAKPHGSADHRKVWPWVLT